jgi:hypothetical protein
MTRMCGSRRPLFAAVARGFVIALLSISALLAGGSMTTSGAPKTVHVRQYTRKDGTVVKAYDRAAPGTAQHRAAATPKQSTARPPAAPSGTTAKSGKTPPTVKSTTTAR